MKRSRVACLALGVLAACAPLPRPAVLEEVDRTRGAAAAKEAEALAPQAYLLAEKLRADAARAADDGDRPGAELLGEQALAAYEQAFALARVARADTRQAEATRRLEHDRVELTALEAELGRVTAEADDLELRVKVTQAAFPLPVSEPASPDRERARLGAARALATESRLLCVAAHLLAPEAQPLAETFTALDALDAELAAAPAHAPVDAAVRLRSRCLSALTSVRRAQAATAPEAGTADALLDELGRAGLSPLRDDRGVVVVLREDAGSQERLTALGQVAKAHPQFPVLVVTHSAKGTGKREADRGAAVARTLTDAGAPRVETRHAGAALPIALPGRADTARRNERIEIVFVSPSL